MKTIGIIGGIGPESTIDYYRSLMKQHTERWPERPPASIIINSIDLGQMLQKQCEKRGKQNRPSPKNCIPAALSLTASWTRRIWSFPWTRLAELAER
jgi:aspartate/glutamate racemase